MKTRPRGSTASRYHFIYQRKDRDIVRYIVEARAGDRWVALGQPYMLKEKAMAAEEAALESTFWEDARILVVNDRKQIVKIID